MYETTNRNTSINIRAGARNGCASGTESAARRACAIDAASAGHPVGAEHTTERRGCDCANTTASAAPTDTGTTVCSHDSTASAGTRRRNHALTEREGHRGHRETVGIRSFGDSCTKGRTRRA